MERYPVWIAFLIVFQLTAVLGRNPIHEYFYNKYHHKDHSSTTDAISSSISGDSENIVHTSTGNFEDIKNSSQGVSENVANASTGNFDDIKNSSQDDYDASLTPPTLQHGGYYRYYGDNSGVIAAVFGITFGCIVFLSICSCCLFFCILRIRSKGWVRRGLILGIRQDIATEVLSEQPILAQRPVQFLHPQKPLIVQQYLQPVATQYYPQQFSSGTEQASPPNYQSTPEIQQQHSQIHSMSEQSHTPPEAPRPQEFSETFELRPLTKICHTNE